MAAFSGKFQYLNPDSTLAQGGPCHISFDKETFTLSPTTGAPLVFDLGDVDVFSPADFELGLTLYTGKKLLLQQFGKAFQNLVHDLLEAWRNRTVQCLLLEDLEEIARFEGFARLVSPSRSFASPAEFRLHKSNLAVLPLGAAGFQWRLADIENLKFDETAYTVSFESGNERLEVTRLAKRTSEFFNKVSEAVTALAEKAAAAVHNILPFLNPDQFQQAAALLKEGRAASLARLRAIDPKIEKALVENVVDEKLKPYFNSLMPHVPAGFLYAGFKLLRKGEVEQEANENHAVLPQAAEDQESPATGDAENSKPAAEQKEEEPILHWFFFPLASPPGASLPGNLVAWEATSTSGRATYFFRLLPAGGSGELSDKSKASAAIESAVAQLNRAIVLLNFRREPIYLSDEKLELQPRYRRYAIACRKIPELRNLRASFLGRAIHTSPEAWQKQVDEFLAKA